MQTDFGRKQKLEAIAVAQDDVLSYMGSMLSELRDMADSMDLPILTYFIDMALDEVITHTDQVDRGTNPPYL